MFEDIWVIFVRSSAPGPRSGYYTDLRKVPINALSRRLFFAVGASLCERLWHLGTFGGLEASVPEGISPSTIANLVDLSASSMEVQLKQAFSVGLNKHNVYVCHHFIPFQPQPS